MNMLILNALAFIFRQFWFFSSELMNLFLSKRYTIKWFILQDLLMFKIYLYNVLKNKLFFISLLTIY